MVELFKQVNWNQFVMTSKLTLCFLTPSPAERQHSSLATGP